MVKISKRLASIFAAFATAIALQGCANTTSQGAIGLERSQMLIISSKAMNEQASQSFIALNRVAQAKNILNTDKALTNRVKRIAIDLIGHVGVFREDAHAWDWQVSVYENSQVNAFCAPGGKIGVFSGIIRKLNLNDHEIAAVIGHEIAHALREHSREKISQQAVSALVSTAAGAAIGISPQLLEQGSSLLVHLPNSRAMELEADIIGLELMARAGYDPRQASSLWNKIESSSTDKKNNVLLSTHPASSERIKHLDANVPKVISFYENNLAKKR